MASYVYLLPKRQLEMFLMARNLKSRSYIVNLGSQMKITLSLNITKKCPNKIPPVSTAIWQNGISSMDVIIRIRRIKSLEVSQSTENVLTLSQRQIRWGIVEKIVGFYRPLTNQLTVVSAALLGTAKTLW